MVGGGQLDSNIINFESGSAQNVGTGSSGSSVIPVNSNLSMWLDASNIATIISSGGFVSQWNDLSVNGNNATQSTSGQRPITGSKTINGRNVISFAGNNGASSQWMSVLNMTSNTQTIFSVWRCNTSTYTDWSGVITARQGGNSFKVPASTNNSGFTGDLAVNTNVCNVGQVTTACAVDGVAKTPSDFDNFLIGLNTSPITSPHILMLQSSGNSSGTQNYGIGCDVFDVVGARHINGDIAELIVYNSTLNSTDIASVTSYLRTKWGI